jgi:MFS family permease
LRASLGDGVGFGGMVGMGETYLPAFALAVGLGELVAGLVASVPLLAGGVLQTVSPWGIRRLGSHKRWVLGCATIQALSFLPLLVAALRGGITGGGLLIVATLYWAAGLATGPAWNTWIGTLVPRPIRARFFARRTRFSQAAVFAGFLSGGLALQAASSRQQVLVAFAALFAVAGGCRLVSVWMLARQSEPIPIPKDMQDLNWRAMGRCLACQSSGRLLLYLVAIQAAVQVSGPFFAPFMLKQLEFSYGAYVSLISLAYLAKVMTLPLWGNVAQRVGAWRLLWIGSLGIVPLSAAWLLSQHLAWLCALQVVGGMAWGAYELAFFLLFFESIREEERTSLLTLYNLINTSAVVIGSLIGGALLLIAGTTFSAYLMIFALSGFARLAALGLLTCVIPRDINTAGRGLGLRTMAVRPNTASLDVPILPGTHASSQRRESVADPAPERTTLDFLSTSADPGPRKAA